MNTNGNEKLQARNKLLVVNYQSLKEGDLGSRVIPGLGLTKGTQNRCPVCVKGTTCNKF